MLIPRFVPCLFLFLVHCIFLGCTSNKPTPEEIAAEKAAIENAAIEKMANTFKMLDTGFEKSNNELDKKTIIFMDIFELRYRNDPARINQYYRDARKAIKFSDDFFTIVVDLKKSISLLGGDSVLIKNDNASKVKQAGDVLLDSLFALQSLMPADTAALAKYLSFAFDIYPNKTMPSSASSVFNGAPDAGALAILNRLQCDAKIASGVVIEILLKKTGGL